MKFSRLLTIAFGAVMLVACGSNNTQPVVSYGSSTYNPYGGAPGTQTSCANAACTAYNIPGGTETQTPLFYSAQTSINASNKTFSETATVVPGDRIVVLMSGAWVQGTIGYSTVNKVEVKVNGISLGQGTQAEYLIPIGGTGGPLSVNIDWPTSANSGQKTVSIGYGIWVLHCTDTNGAAMNCPVW